MYIFRLTFLALIFSVYNNCPPKAQATSDYKSLIEKGNEYYNLEQFSKSFRSYSQALQIVDTIPEDLYNAACIAALIGKDETAIQLLEESVDRGFYKLDLIQKDCDLYSLRKHENWQTILTSVVSNLDAKRPKDRVMTDVPNRILNLHFAHLREFSSNELRNSVNQLDFFNTVQEFNRIFDLNGMKLLDDKSSLYKTSTIYQSTTIRNDEAISYQQMKWRFLPVNMGGSINRFLVKRIGDDMLMELKNTGDLQFGWQLNDLKVKSNYFSQIDGLSASVYKMLVEPCSVYKFAIRDSTTLLQAESKFLSSNIEKLIETSSFELAERKLYENQNPDKTWIYIMYGKELEKGKPESADQLVFIVTDQMKESVLIAYNHEYGIIKINFREELIEFIESQFEMN